MAAIKPIGTDSRKNTEHESSFLADSLKIATIVLLVAGACYLAWAHAEWFDDPQRIKAEVLRLGIWGPIGFILMFAVGPSLLVPGAIMTIAGGLAFGTWWGAAYAIVGADAGALVAFAIGRALGKGFVQRLIGERFQHVLDRVARNGFHIILYLRFFPIANNFSRLLLGEHDRDDSGNHPVRLSRQRDVASDLAAVHAGAGSNRAVLRGWRDLSPLPPERSRRGLNQYAGLLTANDVAGL